MSLTAVSSRRETIASSAAWSLIGALGGTAVGKTFFRSANRARNSVEIFQWMKLRLARPFQNRIGFDFRVRNFINPLDTGDSGAMGRSEFAH